MQQQMKVALALLGTGILIPLLLLQVTSNYDPTASFLHNILHMEIVVKGLEVKVFGWTRIAIPYRFPLAAGIFLFFLGVRALDQIRTAKNRAMEPDGTDSIDP
jgi:hypothetical protein